MKTRHSDSSISKYYVSKQLVDSKRKTPEGKLCHDYQYYQYQYSTTTTYSQKCFNKENNETANLPPCSLITIPLLVGQRRRKNTRAANGPENTA